MRILLQIQLLPKTNLYTNLNKPKYTTNNVFMFHYRIDDTTPFHKPGIYAPLPPKGGDRLLPKEHYVLLPFDHNSQYTVIEPHGQPTSDSLLSPENHGEVKPIVEPKPDSEPLLPFEETIPVPRTDDGISIDDEEFSDENLQYLAPELRAVIKLANDPTEERAIDIWGDDVNRKAYIQQSQTKGKLSSSNLRLMLLYDLLSREAKRQKLSDYSVSIYFIMFSRFV